MNPFEGNGNSHDMFLAEIFAPEEAPAISDITSHYQQKISKDIEDMTKLLVQSAQSSAINPVQKLSNDEVEKFRSITKIQNSVLFITNLIHDLESNSLSDI